MVKLLPGLILCSRMMSVISQVAKNKMTLKIEEILTKHLTPSHIDVINESFAHTGISQSSQPELASHLKIVVVSSQFENKPPLAVSTYTLPMEKLLDCSRFFSFFST